MPRLLAALLGLAATTLMAGASTASDVIVPEAFAFYPSVFMAFTDSVEDGCLPNAKAAQNAFELELLDAGVPIEPQPAAGTPLIDLEVSGYAVRSGTVVLGCVGVFIL